MKTTKFFYIQGYGNNEHFTNLNLATRRAKKIIRDLKKAGDDSGELWIMGLEIEWPIKKSAMIKVLNGNSYAEKVFEVSKIEW